MRSAKIPALALAALALSALVLCSGPPAPRAAFPMHARAGDARYVGFREAFRAKFPGLPIHVPLSMGQKFVYADGRIEE